MCGRLRRWVWQNNCELRTTVPIACQISKLVQIKVCLILSIGLQSKNKRLTIFYEQKNIRQNVFFFFDKEHAKKMWISLLKTPSRQKWYFAHCHVHVGHAVCQYRFSAFWLRSKCSICSYQLNIWYGGHVPPSILNWFLEGDRVQELAPALSRVDLVLQYRQDRPTSPLIPKTNSNVNNAFLYNF